jgi:deoxyribose-phosphate aldolase
MELTLKDIARMLDISAVQADSTESDVRNMATLARKYDCAACFAMPAYTGFLVELLSDSPQIGVGGVIGFPSGANTTQSKIFEASELLELGCNELDMVINIGRLKSGDLKYVYEDMHAVVKVAGDVPVKVILECYYLTNDEIQSACGLVVKAGAAFVKTGTGWAPNGTTADNIALITKCVGGQVQVKAAGGVRDLEMLLKLYRLGTTRFGVSTKSATVIMQQTEQMKNESIYNCL